MPKKIRRIIGVDPGTRITGYGVVDVDGPSLSLVTCGSIKTTLKLAPELRYHEIFQELSALLDLYQPEALAVETQFVYKNVGSALKLGMARGVIMLAATLRHIPVFEYAPRKVKMAVSSSGGSTKSVVQKMIQLLLALECLPEEDVADALALAICHTHHTRKLSYV